MKAIVLNQPGGTENIEYKDIPVPEIKADEVLVKVKAIGLNPVASRQGKVWAYTEE